MVRSLFAGLLVAVLAPQANAAATYAFSGTVDGAGWGVFQQGDPVSPLPFALPPQFGEPGTGVLASPEPLTVTFTIDDQAVDSLPGDPTQGLYLGAILAMSVNLGELEFQYDPRRAGAGSSMRVIDNPGNTTDSIGFSASLGAGTLTGSPADLYQVNFVLLATGIYWNSDGIPYLAGFPTDYPYWGTDIEVNDGYHTANVGTYGYVTYVPEPSALLLLGASALALGALRSRRPM
jgi:hypothetical protein